MDLFFILGYASMTAAAASITKYAWVNGPVSLCGCPSGQSSIRPNWYGLDIAVTANLPPAVNLSILDATYEVQLVTLCHCLPVHQTSWKARAASCNHLLESIFSTSPSLMNMDATVSAAADTHDTTAASASTCKFNHHRAASQVRK
jgi:hypothetical protein